MLSPAPAYVDFPVMIEVTRMLATPLDIRRARLEDHQASVRRGQARGRQRRRESGNKPKASQREADRALKARHRQRMTPEQRQADIQRRTH